MGECPNVPNVEVFRGTTWSMNPHSNVLVWPFPDWEPPKRALPCAGVCTRLSVCKQAAQLKGWAPALPAPGCVPPLALLPLSMPPLLLLLSVLVPCQALTWESSQVSETSPCHSPGGGDLCGGRLTPLGTFQADVSRRLCSSLTFPGILCVQAPERPTMSTLLLGLSRRSWDCHVVLDCHIVLGLSHIFCDCHIVPEQ